ncbi:MAG: hypothetical protein CV087_20420 [Candidatus Brocadia sp. WS118]|nr:MAG: hypothetical protein CV087_20420 [Candidatus Brocadia sp. WS118]
MPTSLILTKITDHLSDISFSRKSVEKEITVHHTFKELIISGSGVHVSILDKKLFEVKLSSDLYSKALSADYFFSKQKTSNHFKCINSFTDPALPLSWLVVTLYYSCFFSAVEILRLCGVYSSYFNKEDCSEFTNLSIKGGQLEPGNYYGSVSTDQGYIKITFRRSNLGSHELVWDSIKSIFGSFDLNKIPGKKLNKINFINDVFKEKLDLDYPNVVRNCWNYSKSNSYDPIFDRKYGKFRSCLSDKSHALNLDVNHKKNEKELNELLFIWILNIVIQGSLDNVSNRILLN